MAAKETYPDATLDIYGGVGPSYGGVWGLKFLGFEGPGAVWSVWVQHIDRPAQTSQVAIGW